MYCHATRPRHSVVLYRGRRSRRIESTLLGLDVNPPRLRGNVHKTHVAKYDTDNRLFLEDLALLCHFKNLKLDFLTFSVVTR